ncbi:TIGR02450 family Trp-rich protein [Microcoleus sp. FACHB-1515]|uniref:TIGR02450 family Trp-rich protein n=1 Tax=Cyanophyceae TaxID=3028117 RepID=UPI001683B976|nr:TIGR02450 family Trp-rich protein [Microcoleus sp. FACHB-1515]MBD2088778.1 TIGR02450 family Trp-rich protein [Microcoleus sp. FACHB-1515]
MPKKQKFPYLVGSRWTAQQETWGWRHFQVVNRKNEGQWVFAEMVAACDPTVRFWLNARQLKDRKLWRSGWQTMQEMGIDSKAAGIPDAFTAEPPDSIEGDRSP